MALIQCPECGKNVSTKADKCPHCDYPISVEDKIVKEFPKPKGKEWIYKYTTKKIITISIMIILSILLFGVCRYFLNLYQTDKIEVHLPYIEETFYETKPEWLLFTLLFGLIFLIFVIVTIICPFTIKIRVYNIDGYNIVLYNGLFKDAIIIENVVFASEFDSMFHATYLDGELPNGKKVYSRFCWGSIRLETKSFYEKLEC